MRAKQVDRNHSEIVKGLRSAGRQVFDASRLGRGFPDLIVGHNGRTHLLEIKHPDRRHSKSKLTPDQAKFFAAWTGSKIHIVYTIEDAIRVTL